MGARCTKVQSGDDEDNTDDYYNDNNNHDHYYTEQKQNNTTATATTQQQQRKGKNEQELRGFFTPPPPPTIVQIIPPPQQPTIVQIIPPPPSSTAAKRNYNNNKHTTEHEILHTPPYRKKNVNIPSSSHKKTKTSTTPTTTWKGGGYGVRESLVRVGSRIFHGSNNNSLTTASRINNNNNNNKGNGLHQVPLSPATRASNYNHVQDAVAINFQEAVSERGRDKVPLGIVGFYNMGNTCYLNASLQCLSATIPLTDYFLGYNYKSEINTSNPLGTGGKLATEYAQLMKIMWLGSHTNTKHGITYNYDDNTSMDAITPASFKRTLAKFATQFSGCDQNDSQELLSYLLDGIHEDLNRIKTKPYIEDRDCDGTNDEYDAIEAWKNYLRRDKSLVVDLFQGQLRNEMKCLKCYHKNIRFEPFMYLSLPISDDCRTITDCLDLYCNEEYMTGDNQWYCSKCKKHRDATKKVDLWVLPPILIVHLKRFRFNDIYGHRGCKNNVPIKYPIENWDLSQYVKSRGAEKPMYDLYAISNHIGNAYGCGHYTAYTQNRFNDKWYEFNDSRYRIISESDMKKNTSSAYVLFYNRVNGTENNNNNNNGTQQQLYYSGDSNTSRTSVNSNSSNSNNRVPLIRRQSVSRPDLWPHMQVIDNQFREYSRSSARKIVLPHSQYFDQEDDILQSNIPPPPLSLFTSPLTTNTTTPNHNTASNSIRNQSTVKKAKKNGESKRGYNR